MHVSRKAKNRATVNVGQRISHEVDTVHGINCQLAPSVISSGFMKKSAKKRRSMFLISSEETYVALSRFINCITCTHLFVPRNTYGMHYLPRLFSLHSRLFEQIQFLEVTSAASEE